MIHIKYITHNYSIFKDSIFQEGYLFSQEMNYNGIIAIPKSDINRHHSKESRGVDLALFNSRNHDFLFEKQKTIFFYNSSSNSLIFFGKESYGIYFIGSDLLVHREISTSHLTYNNYTNGNNDIQYQHLPNMLSQNVVLNPNGNYVNPLKLNLINFSFDNEVNTFVLTSNVNNSNQMLSLIEDLNGTHEFNSIQEVRSKFNEVTELSVLYDLDLKLEVHLNSIENNLQSVKKNRTLIMNNKDFFISGMDETFHSFFKHNALQFKNENCDIDYLKLFNDLSIFCKENINLKFNNKKTSKLNI